MAINQNHLFEDLDGVKCSIVEKNASKERVGFLRRVLEFNRYTVVVVGNPPPKAAAAAAPAPDPAPVAAPVAAPAVAPAPTPVAAPTANTTPTPTPAPGPPPEETFTIGVTDTMFNPTNAIFGRLLRTPSGHVVTLAYWQQKDSEAHDEVPYFDR